MKTLILYYSYGGNTKRIAEMIHFQQQNAVGPRPGRPGHSPR